jgi:MoxR-like ATPase
VVSYAVSLAAATRSPAAHGVGEIAPYVEFGASPRGPISLVQSARALALVRGRDYVLAQDLEALARDALRHRLVLSYQALAEEVGPDRILDDVLKSVPLPEIDLSRASAA